MMGVMSSTCSPKEVVRSQHTLDGVSETEINLMKGIAWT